MANKGFIYIDSSGTRKALAGSTGGNGTADSSKPLVFNSFGGVTVTDNIVAVHPSISSTRAQLLYDQLAWFNVLNGGFSGTIAPISTGLSAARLWELPNKSGTVAMTSDIPTVPTVNVWIHPPVTSSTSDSTGTALPFDNTIPQSGEGKEYLTITITPKNASSALEIVFTGFLEASTAAGLTIALFQDSTADALSAVGVAMPSGGNGAPYTLRHIVSAAGSGSRTYKIRFGASTGTAYMMRRSGDVFSTAKQAVLSVTEILP